MKGAQKLLIVFTLAVLRVTQILCFVTFLFINFIRPTAWYSQGRSLGKLQGKISFIGQALEYRVHDLGLSHPDIVNGRNVLEVTFLWSPVLIAALSTLLHTHLKRALKRSPNAQRARHGWKVAAILCKKVLRYDLPPKMLWEKICGSLSLLDALLVLIWVGLHAIWVVESVVNYTDVNVDGPDAGELTTVLPAVSGAPQCKLATKLGDAFGKATVVDLTLLFFPLPRNSFLHYLFQTDFSGLIKYHKWLAYGTILVSTIHGCIYYVVWMVQNRFWHMFWLWKVPNGHSILAGNIALLFALFIFATSLERIRRSHFEVFYKCHLFGFIGFTAFSFMHFWGFWYYQVPGLVLYLMDCVFRLGQWLQPSLVAGHFVTDDKSVITLQFAFNTDAELYAGHYMWINIPGTSRMQWHPFSVAAVHDSDLARRCNMATLHVKRFGDWTGDAISQMISQKELVMRVDGPYGHPGGPDWQRFSVLVIFTGGIGVTPILGMLRDMLQTQRALEKDALDAGETMAFSKKYGRKGLPSHVHVVWAARSRSEFSLLLDKELIQAAKDPRKWLVMDLFYTGTKQSVGKTVPLQNKSKSNLSKFLKRNSSEPKVKLAPYDGLSAQYASSFGLKPSLLAPYSFGKFHWACIHVLAFFGCWCTCLMAEAYSVEGQKTRPEGFQWAQIGLLVFIGVFVGAMGLPALAILPVHIFRAWLSTPIPPTREISTSDSSYSSTSFMTPKAKGSPASSYSPSSLPSSRSYSAGESPPLPTLIEHHESILSTASTSRLTTLTESQALDTQDLMLPASAERSHEKIPQTPCSPVCRQAIADNLVPRGRGLDLGPTDQSLRDHIRAFAQAPPLSVTPAEAEIDLEAGLARSDPQQEQDGEPGSQGLRARLASLPVINKLAVFAPRKSLDSPKSGSPKVDSSCKIGRSLDSAFKDSLQRSTTISAGEAERASSMPDNHRRVSLDLLDRLTPISPAKRELPPVRIASLAPCLVRPSMVTNVGGAAKIGDAQNELELEVINARPVVDIILSQLSKKYEYEQEIGVYGAGPPSMTENVRRACSAYNSNFLERRPFLDYASHVFSL